MKRFLLIFLLSGFLLSCGKRQDPNTVTMWHWMTDRHKVFLHLAKQYEEQTGTKVNIELYAPPDAYTQRVVASAQAKVLPDIYGVLDKKEIFASFVKSGFIANLTEEFKKDGGKWSQSLFPKALAVSEFKKDNIYNIPTGIYGVPIDVSNQQMLYNKKLLAKVGVNTPPKTFDEFLDVCDKLKKIGVGGFVSGWGELWLLDCFASNYAFNIMDEAKIMKTYKGEVSYLDEDWITVFSLFKTLADRGALLDGIITKQNKYAEQDFALERAAFTFNGSWCVNVYKDMNPELEYGVMLPPKLQIDKSMSIWGGAGASFVINKSSERKDKAIAFLKWLTSKDQQAHLSKETNNLPANRESLGQISEVLADFAKGMEVSTHPRIWKYNEDPLVIEKFDKGIQAIIMGKKTPEQVAKEVQEVKEMQMKKKKK